MSPPFFSCEDSIIRPLDTETSLVVSFLDYVWLSMTTYDFEWPCMIMYYHVWQCMSMYDCVFIMHYYVLLNMTLFDYVWLCMTLYERKRERDRGSKSNFTNFFILLQKFANNLNFFIWFKCFEQTSTLFTFVYLCLPLFNWRIYAQILCLFLLVVQHCLPEPQKTIASTPPF